MQNVEERANSCRNLERWRSSNCGIHAEEKRMRLFNRVKKKKQRKTLLLTDRAVGDGEGVTT